MKRPFLSAALWLLLLILATGLNAIVYRDLYRPVTDPIGNIIKQANPILDFVLVFVSGTIFAMVGAVMTWRLQGKLISIAVAMSIGSVGLALGIAIFFPWMLLRLSPPSMSYGRILVLAATITPPMAGAVGALLYHKFRRSVAGAT